MARNALFVVLTACLLSPAACTYDSPFVRADPPAITPAPAHTELPLDRRINGQVDCASGECMRRYRISIKRHGELNVFVEPVLDEPREIVRVILEDPVGNVMGQQSTDQPGERITLGGPAQPGYYAVLIHSATGETDYTLLATLDTRGAPQVTMLESEVEQMQPPPQRPRVPLARGTSVAPPTSIPQAAEFASNPSIDFGNYRTYAFARDPQQLLKSKPGAYVGNPFIDQEIERAIRRRLADSGYVMASPEQAQFLVNFHTGSTSQAWYTLGGNVYGYSYGTFYGMWNNMPGYYGGVVRTDIHTEGTLVIDIIDLESKELVWHGWATKTTGWKDDEVVIREAVAEVLAKFPPS